MNTATKFSLAFLLCSLPLAAQQNPATPDRAKFEGALQGLEKQLADSLTELDRTMQQVAEEKLPLGRTLRDLEAELAQLRQLAADRTRQLDVSSQELNNLTADQKRAKDEQGYLSNVFGEYVRNFESSLHIAEVQVYEQELKAARLAAENQAKSAEEVFEVQAQVVSRSIDRLDACLSGLIFDGSAVTASGIVKDGKLALIGPYALFRSKDGQDVGTVDQKLGSLQPSVTPFPLPEQAAMAAQFVAAGSGPAPVDPTLGSAHKVAQTQETLVEHFLKGGPIMWPILVLASAALLVALYKWVALSLIRRPSRRQIKSLLESVRENDVGGAKALAADMKGPVGQMLAAAAQSLEESRELLEEVMFERILTSKHKIQSLLPFVSVAAASAPLLGLLGTVTGIIQTFKQITIYGSGDVKSLSGGISEALITTESGLVVAIPSLLLHAFLSRKARGITSEMETLAVSFANAAGVGRPVGAQPHVASAPMAADPESVRAQVRAALGDLLGPMLDDDGAPRAKEAR